MKTASAQFFRSTPAAETIQRAASWLAELSGWRRALAAWLLGVLASAALPPFDVVPVLVPAFAGLLWLDDGTRTKRGAFALGWMFGFGYFVAGLYWIAIAMLVDAARFWWLMPFAAAGLPAYFGIFTGGALLATRLVGGRGVARAVAFAVLWTVGEWLRGHVLTGFPWNALGYAWSGGFPGSTGVLQSTALFGTYGLTFLTVLAAALPATLAERAPGRARYWAPSLAALGLVAVLGIGGAIRLAGATHDDVPGVRLRLVQPSIAQSLKWDPAAREANFRRHLALSSSPGSPPVTHVIWPESAATYIVNRDDAARQAIAAIAPPGGLVLTGAPRVDPPPGPPQHIWNSLLAIDHDGTILAWFDKFHLVPFGEYVPLRGVLPIQKITPGAIDFSAGPGPRTLDLPGVPPVGPLICYEVIFPGEVVDEAHRPSWLLNVTNDAWYGFSSGPFQHFAIARVRAVEEGLPLVRSANNGISAIVDPWGRVRSRLSLDAVGVLDGNLPQALPPTPFARYGEAPLAFLLVVGAVFVAWRRRAA